MTADLRIFKLASGKEGADKARLALNGIEIWSQTSVARQACVHAVQIFLIMSERRTIDRTSYEAEVALVHAALVLGLYVFVMPQDETETNDQAESDMQPATFELLDQVDWDLVSDEGFCNYPANDAPICLTECLARSFICTGGTLLFSGGVQHGGYASARRILLEYVYFLEDISSDKVAVICHILRVLSDALIDIDSGDSE